MQKVSWGIMFILIGVFFIINIFMPLNIPLWRIIVAIIFVQIGLSILLDGFEKKAKDKKDEKAE